MVKQWKIDKRIDSEPVIFLGCTSQEFQCELLFCNYSGLRFKIKFLEAVDAIEIKHLEASVLCNASVAQLMEEAQCTAPINPFFIQVSPNQVVKPMLLSIDEFLAEAYYGEGSHKNRTLMQYIMVANGTWINVFSYSPPTIILMEEGTEPSIGTPIS